MIKNSFILIGLLIGVLHGKTWSQEGIQSSRISNTLSYGSLSEAHLDSLYIYSKVDSIMAFAIKKSAFPGAQLLVAKNGKIVFHEAYGHHTYRKITPVGLRDLYDIASVTKITAALPALMKMVDEGKLQLDAPFSTYWKPWRNRKDKKHLTLREILSHQAGLEPYIVFLNKAMKKGRFKRKYIREQPKPGFKRQAFKNIFVSNRFKKKVYRSISNSPVATDKKYKYSGLSFLLYPELIQQLTGKAFETYLQESFYQPLGTSTLGFNPWEKKHLNAVVPTEKDTFFRKELTQGWVHDENAALLGGVSGNAGLFATAEDLATLMQLYLQNGVYNNKRYFSEEIVKEFTKVQYSENGNRRGLGFDKPLLNNSKLPLEKAYPAPEASPESYGHAGFTGTFVWADPKNQSVFIFLSNRVYPSRTHRNLYNLHIRTALQQVFYKAESDNTE